MGGRVKKSLILLSGGLDSTVLLADFVSRCRHEWAGEWTCEAIAFDYGQRHRRELQSAVAVAAHYGVPLAMIPLPAGFLTGSSLTYGNDTLTGPPTVVPGRNLVFLSLAVAHAAAHGFLTVQFGAHAGDAETYPDCRPAFVSALNQAARPAYGVTITAPFLTHDKRGIVTRGRLLNVPFDMTWSCYAGGETPCGGCGACVERAKAMG